MPDSKAGKTTKKQEASRNVELKPLLVNCISALCAVIDYFKQDFALELNVKWMKKRKV